MEQIWKICVELHDISFYELENPRDKLVIFDQYELEYLNFDPDKVSYTFLILQSLMLHWRGMCSKK